jgi:hypothetical protein
MNFLKLAFYILVINYLFCFTAFAKISEPEYEKNIKQFPIYPNARIFDINDGNLKMKVHLTEASFEKVSNFYVSKMLEKGWKIVFPDPVELEIWMEALYSDKSKTPNLMLSLTKPKTKFNCNITIGVVKDARSPNDLTIITIYLTDAMLK